MMTVIIDYTQDPESGFWTATAPAFPALLTQGKTQAEAAGRVRAAFRLLRPHLQGEEIKLGEGRVTAVPGFFSLT
jgi:predicted RNase H-like HicB family nuclease